MNMDKFYVEIGTDRDKDSHEFDTIESAINEADILWRCLSDRDKKTKLVKW